MSGDWGCRHAGHIRWRRCVRRGASNPPSQDGQINAAPLAALAAPIQLRWAGGDFNNPTILPITFATSAPSLAAGIFQVNFIAPEESLMGVQLLMENYSTQFDVLVQ